MCVHTHTHTHTHTHYVLPVGNHMLHVHVHTVSGMCKLHMFIKKKREKAHTIKNENEVHNRGVLNEYPKNENHQECIA